MNGLLTTFTAMTAAGGASILWTVLLILLIICAFVWLVRR